MGICQSNTDAESKHNKSLDRILYEEKVKDQDVVKMLLLGAGESGKSTIFKQLKILHEKGFSVEEREDFRVTVRNNLFENIKDLIFGAEGTGCYHAGEDEEVDKAVKLIQNTVKPELKSEIVEAIRTIWGDKSMKRAFYDYRSQFQIADSAAHFFDGLSHFVAPDYLPSDDDILRARVRTTGVTEMPFTMYGVQFRLFDVGGQRTERRKWIHCFQDTNALIYVAALNEYDLQMFEDNTTNRMEEALKLFSETCNLHYFEKTAMLLFLNKKDLFEEKITSVPLTTCFPLYRGGLDYQSGLQYITDQFLSKNLTPSRNIYVHVTCATDTGNIKFVFDAVQDVIFTSNLQTINF